MRRRQIDTSFKKEKKKISEALAKFDEAYSRIDPEDQEQTVHRGGSDLTTDDLARVRQAKTAADAFNEAYR